MFAHVYNAAKRILSRSPSVQERSSEARDTSPTSTALDLDNTMVTTRRGTDTPGNEPTPRSAAKTRTGKRELDALDTPTTAKRQRRTVPRATEKKTSQGAREVVQDSTDETSDTIVVERPPKRASSKEDDLPIRRRSSPVVVIARKDSTEPAEDEEANEEVPASTQDSVYETPNQPSSSVYATPATKRDGEGSPTPRATRARERAQSFAKKSSGRQKNTHLEVEQTTVEVFTEENKFPDEIPSSTYETEEVSAPSPEAPTTATPAKEAHMRFGSEEPAEPQSGVFLNTQGHKRYEAPNESAQNPALAESDDSGSDSDEAPEVVTTTAAASAAAAARLEKTRALEAQKEKERLKRLQRETAIAQEKSAKKLRDSRKARKLARKAAREQAQHEDEDATVSQPSISLPAGQEPLPALLPTSLLSSLSAQRAPTLSPEPLGPTSEQLHREKLSRHIKFLERPNRGIKDIKKGDLRISVLGQGNKALPPKANRDTRNVRETWLKGRESGKKNKKASMKVGRMERKGFGNGGFLRGDD